VITIAHQALYETARRKLGVTLLAMSIGLPTFIVLTTPMVLKPDGSYEIYADHRVVPHAAQLVASIFGLIARLGSSLWLFLCACAGAGLLSSYLERGWAELLFAKAHPRWHFLFGRYLAVLTLFTVTISIMMAVPALYYGRAGATLIPAGLARTILLLALSFSGLVATMALITVNRAGMALPIIAGFLQISATGAIQDHIAINSFVEWAWLRHVITGLYWILPKHPELRRAAAGIEFGPATLNTLQVWTTLAFTIVVLAGATYRLHRKPL
jgi:ABC-type transport system involved in multi-copper enzyme maturation permease subunit